MKTKMAVHGLLASSLALALAGPARADKLPCEGVTCIIGIPVAVAYVGIVKLAPTPVLIKALDALHERDMPTLKRLVDGHPELVRLTPEQAAALAKMETEKGQRAISERYVLSLESDESVDKGMIEHSIITGNWDMLEYRLITNRRWAAVVDNGYVLLLAGAKTGNLDALRLLLDAGVPADSHKGGAIRAARGEETKQLLLSRAASSPMPDDPAAKDAETCPCRPGGKAPTRETEE